MAEAKKKKKISLIVPCFNEEEALPYFYEETSKVLKSLPEDYELILVNDGSADDTLRVMKELAKKDKKVVYLSFSRNFGKESAMYAGLCSASGDYIGFIDADLQHPPVLMVEMMEALRNKEYDCAACRRVDRTGDSKIRTFFSRLFYRIINSISDAQMIDGAGDYRIMSREMADAIIAMSEYNRFSKGIFGWVGFNTKWLEFENVERKKGETKWSFWKLFKYAVDGIVAFSEAPLVIASFMGLFFAFLAFVFIIFTIVRKWIFGDPTNGWPSLVCIILLVSGLQMFFIGVVGQYLSKTYQETKRRPMYIVKEEK